MSEPTSTTPVPQTQNRATRAWVPIYYLDLAEATRNEGQLAWFTDIDREKIAPLSKEPGFIGFIVRVTPEIYTMLATLKDGPSADFFDCTVIGDFAFVNAIGIISSYAPWDRRVLTEKGQEIFTVPPTATLFICPFSRFADLSQLKWNFHGGIPRLGGNDED